MLKSIDTKLTAVLVVAVFAVFMTLGPAASNFQSAFAHYGVDSEQCKDDEDYYEDNEEACDKDLRLHFGEDYDGDFGSKSIDDDDDNDTVDIFSAVALTGAASATASDTISNSTGASGNIDVGAGGCIVAFGGDGTTWTGCIKFSKCICNHWRR